MSSNNLLQELEAVIFASGTPMPISRIAQGLNRSEKEINKAVDDLIKKYESDDYGIAVIRLNDSVQMCSKKIYGDSVRNVLDIKRNIPLSQAAFEVLAVIAYNQPVTKAFIEQVRGVDCSGVVGSLCAKGLIEEKGRLELPGRPLIYGTTDNFLRCFGVSKAEELPRPESEEKTEKSETSED